HVHRCRAIQCVEGHVQRMPRAGKLQTRIAQWMSVLRDGHLVIQAPAPVALPTEKVIDHALDDLPKRPELSAYGILKLVVPAWPRIFLGDRRPGLQKLAPRG